MTTIHQSPAAERAYCPDARRRPNTRPTSIYWLIDTRTGTPFYCGKTVLALSLRLSAHKQEAKRGSRSVHRKVRECCDHIEIRVVETVPVDEDWGAREKNWIAILRERHPADACNSADGGAGVPGRIVSEETRRKLSARFKGKSTHTLETRAKLSAIGMGRKRPPGVSERISATKKIRTYVRSDEMRARLSAAKKGRPGRPHSPETRAKISAGNSGKKRSPETVARMRAGLKQAHLTKLITSGVCASHFLAMPG